MQQQVSDYEREVREICASLMTEVADILVERAKQYGDPRKNFEDIARAWSLELNYEVTPKNVVAMMKALKRVRHRYREDHDSVIDDIGYTVCGLVIKK